MNEFNDQSELYAYLCEKLESGGLEAKDLGLIGDLSIGQQSVIGMIRVNQYLGHIIERNGRFFTAGRSMVRLTLNEQKTLEEKAQSAGQNPEQFLSQLVAQALSE